MSRTVSRARAGSDRPSLYQEITDKIIAELQAGRVPWVQPWGSGAAKASLAMPKNATTQRQYSGINVLILWDAVIEHGVKRLCFMQASQVRLRTSKLSMGNRGKVLRKGCAKKSRA